MLSVPLTPDPAQTLSILLGDQNVVLTVRQLGTGLFINVVLDNEKIIGLVLCENANRIVRDVYLGFIGDFVFYDNTGAGADPTFDGLGSRYELFYLEAADLV